MTTRNIKLGLVISLAIALSGCATSQGMHNMSESDEIMDQQLVQFSTMLTVHDLAKSEEFYIKYFGFRVTEELDGLRRLQRPDISLYLVTESPPTTDKPGITLAPIPDSSSTPVNLIFRVHDVRATFDALRNLGLEFLAPPAQPPWGGWRVFAQDPDGYLIEIEQP